VDALRIARVPVTSWDMLSVPAASYIAAACLLSVSLVEGVGGALPSAPPAAARVPAARATPWPAALLGPAMLIADARRCDSLPLRPGSLVHRRSPSAACSLAEGPGGVLPSAPPAAARVPAARATPWPAALLGPAMLIADARRRDSLCVFTLALATVRRIMRHADTNCDGRYTIKKFTRVFFGMTGEEYALLNAKGIEALFADCK
jgi:hypothetical protein